MGEVAEVAADDEDKFEDDYDDEHASSYEDMDEGEADAYIA